jgi:hypothetical protein
LEIWICMGSVPNPYQVRCWRYYLRSISRVQLHFGSIHSKLNNPSLVTTFKYVIYTRFIWFNMLFAYLTNFSLWLFPDYIPSCNWVSWPW